MPPVFVASDDLRLVGFADPFCIEQALDPALAGDDDVAVGVERHGVNVVGEVLIRIERDAEAGRRPQTEIVGGKDRRRQKEENAQAGGIETGHDKDSGVGDCCNRQCIRCCGWGPFVPTQAARPGRIDARSLLPSRKEWLCFTPIRRLPSVRIDASGKGRKDLPFGSRTSFPRCIGMSSAYQPESPEVLTKISRLFRDFFDHAEKKRRWNLRDDVPWGQCNRSLNPAIADMMETFFRR